jgi:hypothetical protein
MCQPALAADLLVLDKEFKNITPTFMEGHAGDQDWIKGFQFEGEIVFASVEVGTVTGEVTLLNPPLNMTQKYNEGFGIFNNTITNVGTFQVFAQIKALSASDIMATGNGKVAWHGTIANGTGQLKGLHGLSAGNLDHNLFSGLGSGTEILNLMIE